MSQTLIQIADAVAAELNSPAFQPRIAEAFRAERVYLPDFELQDLKQLKVVVIAAASPQQEFATREMNQAEYGIEIGIQKKVSSTSPEELDPLLAFAGEIGSFLRRRELAAFPEAVPIRLQNDPAYEADLLYERRQFASVIEITYQVLE